MLFDEGALVRDGAAVKLTKSLSALKIPPTVQGILAARIDHLPSDAKDLLQTLAVIGRDFPLSLIRAVVPKSDDELNRLLNDLQLGEFIYEQPAVGDTEYIFKQGLEWIKKLPESLERDASELELASTLAQVLLLTRGFTAPETRAAAEHARDLAEKGGNLAQLVVQVFGIWRSLFMSGDYSTAVVLADRILYLAQRSSAARVKAWRLSARV
jgi:hypothetical protein